MIDRHQTIGYSSDMDTTRFGPIKMPLTLYRAFTNKVKHHKGRWRIICALIHLYLNHAYVEQLVEEHLTKG